MTHANCTQQFRSGAVFSSPGKKTANAASYLLHSVNPNRDEQTVVDGDDGDDGDWGVGGGGEGGRSW